MFSGVSTPAQTRSHQQPASEQPNATPTLRTPHRTAPLQPATGPAPPPTKSPTDASTSAKTSRSILHMSRLIPCTCPELTHRAVHDRRRRKIRDLPVSGRRVTLVHDRRRFVCSNCDVGHLEDHVVFEGALTARARTSERLRRRPRSMCSEGTKARARRLHAVPPVQIRAWRDQIAARGRACAVPKTSSR